jgi:hypothetical protein
MITWVRGDKYSTMHIGVKDKNKLRVPLCGARLTHRPQIMAGEIKRPCQHCIRIKRSPHWLIRRIWETRQTAHEYKEN